MTWWGSLVRVQSRLPALHATPSNVSAVRIRSRRQVVLFVRAGRHGVAQTRRIAAWSIHASRWLGQASSPRRSASPRWRARSAPAWRRRRSPARSTAGWSIPSYRIERDAQLAIVTDKDPDGLEIIRHSTAHLLAYAVKELFPDAQVTIGPVIENGFYYDFSYKRPFTPEDLAAIEKQMAETRQEGRAGDARGLERATRRCSSSSRSASSTRPRSSRRFRPSETISLYREGDFIDLCRGPHVPSTGKLKVFKLMKLAGAYWRGDSKQRDAAAHLRHRLGEEGRPGRLPARCWRRPRSATTGASARNSTCSTCRKRRRAWCSGTRRAGRSGRQVEQYMREVYRDNGYQEVKARRSSTAVAVGAVRATGRTTARTCSRPNRRTATTRSSR